MLGDEILSRVERPDFGCGLSTDVGVYFLWRMDSSVVDSTHTRYRREGRGSTTNALTPLRPSKTKSMQHFFYFYHVAKLMTASLRKLKTKSMQHFFYF